MRFKGRVKEESTACKESKIIRPADNVEILSEHCMVALRKKKSPDQREGIGRKEKILRHVERIHIYAKPNRGRNIISSL
jgi:hypothetical protein